MKNKRIDLRTSETDTLYLDRAEKNLEEQTGQKQNTSKTIRAAVQQLAENKPDLFFINRPALRDMDKNIEQGRARLQAVINEFLKVTGKYMTIAELQNCVSGLRRNFLAPNNEFVRELVITKLIEGKSSEIVGLQLNEAKLRELVVIPDLSDLLAAVEQIMFLPMVNYQEVFYWNCYSVTDGKVIINPEEVEKVKDLFRCYADTPEHKKKLSLVRGLCEYLNKFLTDKSLSPEKLNIPGVCYYDAESKRFEPSEQYVKFGLTPTLTFIH